MAEANDFEPVHVVPEQFQHLGFTYMRPNGWNEVPFPKDPPTFDKSAYFHPLAMCMAPYGAVIFTVAARPAYDDGSVMEWVQWLCKDQGVEIERASDAMIGQIPCILVYATQPSEMGKMTIRLLFVEDGKRLFQLGAMAPEQIWKSVEWNFENMLATFRPDQIMGPTAPLMPGQKAPTPTKVQPPEERPTLAKDVALADDASTFDQNHPMNARLLNSGAGFVPAVVEVRESEKFAVLKPAALMSTIRVPFGWHVLDDSKRTLIFDAGGKMQVSVDVRHKEGKSDDQYLDALLAQYSDQPELQHVKFQAGPYPCLAMRNLKIDGEVLQQAFILKDSKTPGRLIVARITGETDDNMTFAMNATEVVLTHLKELAHERPEVPDPNKRPKFADKADQLVAAGEYEAAEKLLLDSIDHIGAYSSAAYVWERAMAKYLEENDRAGATMAADRATELLMQYAASATSGGEGAALSRERDQRINSIRSAMGFN